MARLPKLTLEKNEKRETWDLKNDKTNGLVRHFESKTEATKGGVPEREVGTAGRSVKIQ